MRATTQKAVRKTISREKERSAAANMTKKERTEVRKWALKYSPSGKITNRELLAVGTWFVVACWSENAGGDQQLADMLSDVLDKKYGPPPRDRLGRWITKQVIEPHRNRSGRGELNPWAMEAIGMAANLDRFEVWAFMCGIGEAVLEGKPIEDVPFGSLGTALIALNRTSALLQQAETVAKNAIASLFDKQMQYHDLSGFFAVYNARYQGRMDEFIGICNLDADGNPLPENDPEYFALERWQELISNPYSLTDEELDLIQLAISEMEETFEESDRRLVSRDFLKTLRDGVPEPTHQRTTHPEENGASTGGHGMI